MLSAARGAGGEGGGRLPRRDRERGCTRLPAAGRRRHSPEEGKQASKQERRAMLFSLSRREEQGSTTNSVFFLRSSGTAVEEEAGEKEAGKGKVGGEGSQQRRMRCKSDIRTCSSS